MSLNGVYSAIDLYDVVVWLSLVGLCMIPAAIVVLLVVVGGQWLVDRLAECRSRWRWNRRHR